MACSHTCMEQCRPSLATRGVPRVSVEPGAHRLPYSMGQTAPPSHEPVSRGNKKAAQRRDAKGGKCRTQGAGAEGAPQASHDSARLGRAACACPSRVRPLCGRARDSSACRGHIHSPSSERRAGDGSVGSFVVQQTGATARGQGDSRTRPEAQGVSGVGSNASPVQQQLDRMGSGCRCCCCCRRCAWALV